MDVPNSSSNDNSNKVFDKSKTDHNSNKNGNGSSDYQSISLKLSEDLQKENVLSEIKYTPLNKRLKITFSKRYNDKVAFEFLDVNKWQNSLKKIEKKIWNTVETVDNHHYQLIEDTLHRNLESIYEADGNFQSTQKNGQTDQGKTIHVNKYEHDGVLYESVIVDRVPKFVCVSPLSKGDDENNEMGAVDDAASSPPPQPQQKKEIRFELHDKLEVSNCSFYPRDSILTHNPIPYSFDSGQELEKYFDLIKKETIDSLFEKVLSEFCDFVNAEEHSLTVLAADTLYSHFQDIFSTTHYNIFVGENGSGKNSALLVFRILGYRVFYITAASAPNYYTFLGDIQEGQGTIAEDEADNIGKSADKKIILKTGYASGGCVPKVGFSSSGARFQQSHLTFCHKWLAMEELPDDKYNRGTFDRSFIHKFMAGEVRYNIKEVLNNKDSEAYKKLQHLRKMLFVFRLAHHHKLSKLPEIKTNLTNRNAELTHFLLRMFYGGQNFERIRKSLSTLIAEKSYLKSNGVEAKICESLKLIMGEEGGGKEERDGYEITNEEFYSKLKGVLEATDNSFDSSGSSFYLPDGTLIKKKRISNLLASKFKAKPFRTNHNRGFTISKKNVKKISEQYRVIDEIIIENQPDVSNERTNRKGESNIRDTEKTMDKGNRELVTDVTDVTGFKSAYTPFGNIEVNGGETSNRPDEQQVKPDAYDTKNDDFLINTEDRNDNDDNKTNAPIDSSATDDNSTTKSNNNDSTLTSTVFGKDATTPAGTQPTIKIPEKYSINHDKNGMELKNNVNNNAHTPSESVTSVTTVTDMPPKYPCYFCGNGYSTNIDFDMELHFRENHRDQLIKLPIRGNLEKRAEYVMSLTKKKMVENSTEYLNDQEEESE